VRKCSDMKNIWRRIAILICVLATVFILSACGKKCAVDGCENKPIKESDYCEEHTCAVEECLLSREVNSNYCNVHTCSMLNCYELVIDGSKCCQEHTCIVEGCFERVKDNSTYCKNHGCAYDGCPDKPIEGGEYCSKHTCAAEGCLNGVATAKPYCFEHACGKAACKNPHISGGEYCQEHTCKVSGCKGGTVESMGYCSKHIAEMAEKEKQSVLAKLSKDYDKVENITWYKPQAYPYYANSRSYVLPYIGVDSYGNAWLRLVFHYTGDSWIFFKKITVSVDGQNYVKDFDYFEVSRDNGSGDVWEYVDISLSGTDINMLRAIAASKETIVRFQGDDYHYDLTVKSSDKSAIISVLDAYSLL
jgi:hypothetical protein